MPARSPPGTTSNPLCRVGESRPGRPDSASARRRDWCRLPVSPAIRQIAARAGSRTSRRRRSRSTRPPRRRQGRARSVRRDTASLLSLLRLVSVESSRLHEHIKTRHWLALRHGAGRRHDHRVVDLRASVGDHPAGAAPACGDRGVGSGRCPDLDRRAGLRRTIVGVPEDRRRLRVPQGDLRASTGISLGLGDAVDDA